MPVGCDVFDTGALTRAVTAFQPVVVFYRLTDLPGSASRTGGQP